VAVFVLALAGVVRRGPRGRGTILLALLRFVTRAPPRANAATRPYLQLTGAHWRLVLDLRYQPARVRLRTGDRGALWRRHPRTADRIGVGMGALIDAAYAVFALSSSLALIAVGK
jgi:hypothetical protein